jgi:hypothetical protein
MECVICNKKIKNKERYVNLRYFNKGKLESECFYHLDCWKNRFIITQEKMNQQANEWMNKLGITINNIKNKMGVKNDEIKIPI